MTATPRETPRVSPWSEDRSNSDDVPAAMLSLSVSTERRARQLLGGMPADLVEGYWPSTDLRTASKTALTEYADAEAFSRNIGRPPLPAEIGCAVSHRKAAAHLLAAGAPLMVLFEDDGQPVEPEAWEVLRGILSRLQAPAREGLSFLCHLGVPPRQRPRNINRILKPGKALQGHRWRLRDAGPAPKIWRAHAYVLSRAAAEGIVKTQSPVVTVADDFAFFQ